MNSLRQIRQDLSRHFYRRVADVCGACPVSIFRCPECPLWPAKHRLFALMEDVRAAIIAGEPAPEEANERLWPAETVVWRSGGGAVWKERTGVFVARIPAGVPVADVVPAVRHVPAKCRKWEKDINTRQDRALIAVREGERLCYYAPPYSIVRSRG